MPFRRLVPTAAFFIASGASAQGVSLDDFLSAADNGQCIESVAYRFIREHGTQRAGGIVETALNALSMREQQQRLLGCEGDIAAQAIAAGADPGMVLKATAAGL